MFRVSKFALLAPVVLFLLLKVEAKSTAKPTPKPSPKPSLNQTKNDIAETKTPKLNATAKSSLATLRSNVSTTSTMKTSPTYVAPHFSGMLKRLIYVTLILSAIIGGYFLIKFCRSGRRKPRKYGVVKTPGDMEMRPLESDDDDDDEDVTMFNRKD
ncbi:membrane protein FAM174-like [Dendronephthya gigantea]|uniref:membrane protein FAM174-like n=1 Tax=Dendronephthya gigantea TaxID=151771 RepID=UPI0010698C65|nr:membrane protein FAM174-like [Dendronephthya gigantea]